MRLKKIKLAGFKSFVDPTTVEFPHQLTGVVGPNGCGKSNIIDAVRWVMGESSAKHLRGQSMEDVIFSGSQARKPVGKAFVELVFDNTIGSKAPGTWAKYADIAIRREVARDGRSDYFINRTRCRKKDIVDIFLGTGLGPRAYSIIEQGMVTRIIDAKPDELRVFVEEAAGISRYKERRRETENRIRHTRENMARVEDIRSELETLLARLKRQAGAARRYKELKQEERRLRGELLALRWQQLTAQLETEDSRLKQRQTQLESGLAQQRGTESEIEKNRQRQHDANDVFNQTQGRYYQVGAEVTRLEQAIQHARDNYQERLREKAALAESLLAAQAELDADTTRDGQLAEDLEKAAVLIEGLRRQSETATADLGTAESAMSRWQQRWEQFSSEAARPAREREVQSARIKQLREHLERHRQRHARLAEERQGLQGQLQTADSQALRDTLDGRLASCRQLAEELQVLDESVRGLRGDIETAGRALNEARVEQQQVHARLETLKELQEAALGQHDQALRDWIERLALGELPRLADGIRVDHGWETAVDRVLGAELGALCLAGQSLPVAELAAPEVRGASFYESDVTIAGAVADDMLCAHVQTDSIDLSARLASIYVAEDVAQAIRRRDELPAHAVTVTRDGTLVGRNWISLPGGVASEAGLMQRQQEIDALGERLVETREAVETLSARLKVLQARLQEGETERRAKRELHARETERANSDNAQLHRIEAQQEQARQRLERLETELRELDDQIVRDQAELTTSDDLLTAASEEVAGIDHRRSEFLAERQGLQRVLEQARDTARKAGEALHEQQLRQQEWEVTRRSLGEGMRRTRQQLDVLRAREHDIAESLGSGDAPELGLKAELAAALERRGVEEGLLRERREAVSTLDNTLRELEQRRHREEQHCQALREEIEGERMKRQEQLVRRQTLEEKLAELDLSVEDVLGSLAEEASEQAWNEELEGVISRINRLGAVNLMAIEEYDEQAERKGYLDKQHADLSEALATLESVMGKIDRETRSRFKETFDQINDGFQRFFPELFGGGHAYLELTGDDLLDTGVTVMARPPGKRNSTINLLSGGEKALTAVALLFAIFELNPAPFCLLDEVDAPLDEANVSRYCNTLKTMAEHTQLIFITHNKVTMESAETLIGVTMGEPGVSRLVSVNLQEAEKLAGQI